MKPVLLVTGGSSGIGAATARMAASRGYAVSLTYNANAAGADVVVGEITAAGGEAAAFACDTADETSIVACFAAVDSRFGPILTGLVNNAGITGPVGPIDGFSGAVIDNVFGPNVRGVYLCLREGARRMGPGGSIVNVSSRASGIGGGGEWVHYAASKGAVDSMTLGAAKEFAPKGIRVNAVNPGLIDTPIHDKAGQGGRMARLSPTVPLGRAGTADEVAEVILFLLSPAASYVTGALVPVSGGR